MLRDTARRFFEREMRAARAALARAAPRRPRDLEQGRAASGCCAPASPRSTAAAAAASLHEAVICEEQMHAHGAGFGNNVHSGIVAHYMLAYGSEAQKQRWLPRMATRRAGRARSR